MNLAQVLFNGTEGEAPGSHFDLMKQEAEMFLTHNGILKKIRTDSSNFIGRIREYEDKYKRGSARVEQMIWAKKK